MEKEKLISKFNIKDYNNQLEKILLQKKFTEDAKNLLLNMLYKIENAYQDYEKVNVDTKTKSEILEEILEIIEKDCDTIEIIKENKSDSVKQEKKIITYLNVKAILYEIYNLKEQQFIVPDEYDILKPSIEYTLNQGYKIQGSEIVRDFDGWSWNIAVEEIEDIASNFIYQTIKMLVGNEFLISWQNNNQNEDYYFKFVAEVEKLYKTEFAEKLIKTINQIAIMNYTNQNEEERKKLVKKEEKLKKEYIEINNKEEYVKKLGNKKKKIVADIKKLDETINDDKKLKHEFIARNELLDMEHRIFSLSDFVEVLQDEREMLMKDLDKCNKNMEPLNYMRMKTELENNLTLLNEIKLKEHDEKNYINKIEEVLKLVCKAIEIQIDKNEEKESLINLLYRVRYYSLIYVDNKKQVKELVNLDAVQSKIITKACKQKIITIFSKNIKENYEIIKNIFKTDIIELEKILFKFNTKDDKLLLTIYDEDNVNKTVEIPKIQDLNVKLNKKIKVINT